MTGRECPPAEHRFGNKPLVIEKLGYWSAAQQCEDCHVGYLLECERTPEGKQKIGYWIFPANGNFDVSNTVTLWAIDNCEPFIKTVQGEGADVIKVVPVIGGESPKDLDEYRHFKWEPKQGLPRQEPPPPPPPLPRWLLLLGLVVLVGAVAAVAVIALHSSRASQSATTSRSTTSQSTTSQSSMSAEEQAADSLSALLAQSAVDRSSIQTAVSDVSRCGPNLSQDPQAFQNAATSRQQLLARLATLPGRSAMPTQMILTLTNAWQASVQADQDFAAWAQDESSQGCTTDDTSDLNYQAATGPDNHATTYKTAFVRLWNPIAVKYGLTTYQWNQL